jgi:rod shape-determining protein MreD
MIKDIAKHARIFLILVLAQVLVLNRIHFSGFINPYLYILFILYLPVGISRPWLMILGFFTGLVVDIFSNTPGMHAAACVLTAFARPFILNSLLSRDNANPDSCPSLQQFGYAMYLKYIISLVLIHHTLLFMIEQFDYMYFWPAIGRLLLSSIATLVFIMIAQLFLNIKTDRRS